LTKDVLVQYSDIVEEVKDLRKRIQKLSDQINKIEQDGCVKDSVKGGYGGVQTYRIEGFPYPEYSRKKTALYLYKAQLENAEFELLELTNKVEEYIQSIDNSRIRRIIRYRLIDGLSWVQVAFKMGGRCTSESVRKELERFMASQ
jgi:hypothetical protein